MPQRSIHKRYSALILAAVIAIALSFGIAAKSTLDRRSAAADQRALSVAADRRACDRINKLYILIQTQVRLSLTTTPQLDYYKKHPAELSHVLARARAQIEAFAPIKCD